MSAMPVHDADGAVAELAASQHGVFTRKQAAEEGMTSRMVRTRLAAGVLREPFAGVLVLTSAAPTWRQRVIAAALFRPGHIFASVGTAAALHRLDGHGEGEIAVHTRRDLRIRLPGVTVHRVASLDSRDVVVVDGIPVTNLARTLADLGSVESIDRVEQALDDARRRGASLRWLWQTAERLHRPGQSGTGTLLRLLESIDPRQPVRDSWFEALIERCLRSPRLPPLERQYRVADGDGQLVARVDVAIPVVKLAVEAHSRRHHFGSQPERRDEERDLRLAAAGWEVLYMGWHRTRAPDELLAIVEAVVKVRKSVV
jgi:very-short-patch-repair endonuclease